jgi:hypothetical protein
MKRKTKKLFLDLIGRDDKEVKKIEKARARRDARFFDDWFDKYNKRDRDILGSSNKRRRDDWL